MAGQDAGITSCHAHLVIIYQINDHFLKQVLIRFLATTKGCAACPSSVKRVNATFRMAHLAVIGSHPINGVSALHSNILKSDLFRDFYELWPERFNNKTNGITQRRWLKYANRWLSDLISSKIGDRWVPQLDALQKLRSLADAREFPQQWIEVKQCTTSAAWPIKVYITKYRRHRSMPNSHVRLPDQRIHEYKRQLLNRNCTSSTRYNRIKPIPA
jgi:starch phosphorylase